MALGGRGPERAWLPRGTARRYTARWEFFRSARMRLSRSVRKSVMELIREAVRRDWAKRRENPKSAVKNFGDAYRVPFVVACCRWLMLLAAFLLCFLFGCHGSILPFHSSWNLQR